jgi:hypothetical protein
MISAASAFEPTGAEVQLDPTIRYKILGPRPPHEVPGKTLNLF